MSVTASATSALLGYDARPEGLSDARSGALRETWTTPPVPEARCTASAADCDSAYRLRGYGRLVIWLGGAVEDAGPARHGGLLRLAVAGTAGILVGVLTSFGQTYLEGTLNPLVNSASMWLVVPFMVGALMRSPASAAMVGLFACSLQVVGYFVTSELRGFPASSSYVVFWTVCALVGGPLFGAGGQLWRSRRPPLAGPASTLLPAVFLAEGIWVYAIVLGYVGSAVLWLVIGAALAVVLPLRASALRWLPITTGLGVAGEVLLTQGLSQGLPV